MYNRFIKRFIDIFFSGIALIILSPIYLTLYLISWIKIGRPVFFHQIRCGKEGKEFMMHKFRSMTNKRDFNGNLLPDEDRLIPYGAWLRNSSLDELPEIWSIFNGDMSIIGPRPLSPKINKHLSDYETIRFKSKGGLLPPEILYNNPFPSWDQQLKWEADYANDVNFKTDFKIFINALRLIFKRGNMDYGHFSRKSLQEERSELIN